MPKKAGSSFRVRYKSSRYHFETILFNDAKEMFKHGKKFGKVIGKYEAAVFPWEKENSDGTRNYCLGLVFFDLKKLTTSTIAHEMFHCAIHHDITVNEGGVYMEHEDEERLADLIDWYVSSFMNNLGKILE